MILAVLSGPVVYVAARAHALDAGFERIKVGDPIAALTAAMGQPQEPPPSSSRGARLDYRYRVWPLPTVWVVAVADGRVVGKTRLRSGSARPRSL